MLVGLHVPTNFQMYRQNSENALLGGGGGQLPPCLPPPPPLATLVFCGSKWFTWDFQEVKGSISHFQHHEIGYASCDDEIMYKCRLLTRFELQTKTNLILNCSQPAYK